MKPLSRYLFPGLVAVFAVACLYGFAATWRPFRSRPWRARGTWSRWRRCARC